MEHWLEQYTDEMEQGRTLHWIRESTTAEIQRLNEVIIDMLTHIAQLEARFPEPDGK